MKITLEKLALAALIGYGLWKLTQKPTTTTTTTNNGTTTPPNGDFVPVQTVRDGAGDLSQFWQNEPPPQNYAPVNLLPGQEGPHTMNGFWPSGLPGARPYMPYGVRWVAANRMKDTTRKAKMVL